MNAGLEKAIQEAMMELDWMTDDRLISLSALEKMTANEKTRTASTSLKSQLALKKRTENMPIFDIACDMWKMTSYLAASDDSLFSLFNFSESETKYEL